MIILRCNFEGRPQSLTPLSHGLSGKAKRFPLKNTCLSIYSATVNTLLPLEEVLQRRFPWCAEWEGDLKRLFLGYVEAKQQQSVLDYDDLLLYWAQMVGEPVPRSGDRRPLQPHPGG